VVRNFGGSVSNVEGSNNSTFNQTDEIVRAIIVPTKVMAAAVALTKGPGMPWEPGVFESWYARLPASDCLSKGNNLELDSRGIGEGEFVFTVVLKSIFLIRHTVEAPGTKPVAGCIACQGACATGQNRLNQLVRCLRIARFHRILPAHESSIPRCVRGSQRGE
jgi:hypothetical protein